MSHSGSSTASSTPAQRSLKSTVLGSDWSVVAAFAALDAVFGLFDVKWGTPLGNGLIAVMLAATSAWLVTIAARQPRRRAEPAAVALTVTLAVLAGVVLTTTVYDRRGPVGVARDQQAADASRPERRPGDDRDGRRPGRRGTTRGGRPATDDGALFRLDRRKQSTTVDLRADGSPKLLRSETTEEHFRFGGALREWEPETQPDREEALRGDLAPDPSATPTATASPTASPEPDATDEGGARAPEAAATPAPTPSPAPPAVVPTVAPAVTASPTPVVDGVGL